MGADGTKKTWEDSNYTYSEEDVWQSPDGQKAYANAADYQDDKPIADVHGSTDPTYEDASEDLDVESDSDDI
ncbi:hypothetical protein [Streptomyces antibioticus]|uniref:hypothetical protein n=1 Tax=Streptomyces antibioticus TaxID=1890 RepID=UPI0033C9A8D6